MGSIKVQARLYLEDGTRYDRLFAADGWSAGQKESAAKDYLRSFADYMKTALGKDKKAYEKLMDELRTMLDWNVTRDSSWKEKIKMMSGDVKSGTVDNRYIQRAILPTATEVVQ